MRFLGYANEVGEAFRPIIPRSVVISTYLVAIGYAAADTVDKGKRTSVENKGKFNFEKAGETALWQLMASVVIPPFFINRTCHFTAKALQRSTLSPLAQRWASTLSGLVAIPIIYKPIDHGVTKLMDYTYAPAVAYFRALRTTSTPATK
jgi:fission process protein 1